MVRVDYEHGQLTLTAPSAFTYQGHGTVVPFRFNEQIPQVDGSIDGFPGKFDIDTGAARGSVTILRRSPRRTSEGALQDARRGGDGLGRRRSDPRAARARENC